MNVEDAFGEDNIWGDEDPGEGRDDEDDEFLPEE